jgi:hypothetical protein
MSLILRWVSLTVRFGVPDLLRELIEDSWASDSEERLSFIGIVGMLLEADIWLFPRDRLALPSE